ncbi:hypothetical protein O9992_22185 [Vibrio lentus]|nr:hypothetical protein [Vibrio lentus]
MSAVGMRRMVCSLLDDKVCSIGSHKNEQGQIYTNGQSWPVISGFATQERATQAPDSVYNKLNTANGIAFNPGYNEALIHSARWCFTHQVQKENGGIFLALLTSLGAMIAEAKMGNGERAASTTVKSTQLLRTTTSIPLSLSSYCYPQNILVMNISNLV